ncbi:MAG: hypothetical protein J4F45_05305 [Pseudomonadales bacterium]|nr:hypothetical protein [Pseudomonadales bacterium]
MQRYFGSGTLVLGQSLQVHASNRRQTVPDQVNGSTTLFQREVAEKGLVFAVDGRHLDEQHLVVDHSETFNLNPRGTADESRGDRLSRGLEVDLLLDGERAESAPPRFGQCDVAGTRIHQRIDFPGEIWLCDVLNVYGGNDTPHK